MGIKNEISLESSGTHEPFMKQFQYFCSSLDKEVMNLNREFEKPSGSYPQLYDQGMKRLKSEIKELKEFKNKVREKIREVQQFEFFVQSTRELLMEQMKDIYKIENYLEKYGYKIPEALLETAKTSDIPQCDKEEERKEEKELKKPTSPQLNEVSLNSLRGKDFKQIALPSSSVLNTPEKEDKLLIQNEKFITPIRKGKYAWHLTPAPHMSTMKKVQKWIDCVQEEALLHVIPMGEENLHQPSLRCKLNFASVTHEEIDGKKRTPDEPVFSSFTTLFLKKEETRTPEEPLLTIAGNLASSNYNSETITPEEPDLSNQTSRKRDFELTSKSNIVYSSCKRNDGTPESPHLSDITKKILNIKPLRYSKEETVESVSYAYEKASNFMEDNLVSPILSDTTLKILRREL